MTREAGEKLSARNVCREVIIVYRRHWLLLVSAAIVILLPQALADAFLDGLQVEGIGSARDAIILAAVPLTVAVNLGGQAIYAGFAASAVVERRGALEMPGVMALARSLPLGRLVVVDIIISVSAAIGFTVLVVPGLLVLTYFGIAPALVKLEHRGVEDALRRSAQLVRGQFWQVLALVTGAIVIAELIVQMIAAPFHGLAVVTLVDLATEGLVQPIEGLIVVVVALHLMERRGEAPAHEALVAALTGSR
jgi:hypothetical protein